MLLEKIFQYEDSTSINHALDLSDLSSQVLQTLYKDNLGVDIPHAQPETSTMPLQGFPKTNTIESLCRYKVILHNTKGTNERGHLASIYNFTWTIK